MKDNLVLKQPGIQRQPQARFAMTPGYQKLYQKSIRFLKKLLRENLPADSRIFLFGSRATGNFSRSSDIDIGLMASSIDEKAIIRIKEIIDESFVPFKVDIIDFSTVDENFKKQALKSIVPWK